MFFGFPTKWIPSTIGLRIAVGYSLLVLTSFLALMVVSHLLLATLLEHRDHDQVLSELEILRETFRSGGVDAAAQTVLANDRFRRNNPFFTRITAAPADAPRLFFPQYWSDYDLSRPVQDQADPSGWLRYPSRNGRYSLDVLSVILPGGGRLEVGIGSEERERTLRQLRKTYLLISLPLLALVLAGGGLLAHRSLHPVRQLVRTLTMINAGRWDVRAPRNGRGDELDELGRLFNTMIERIDILVRGMKNALDTVAHDLRTPMTRFHNRAEVALQQADSPQACRVALQSCVEEAGHILRMLNTLMDISEAETGTLNLNLSQVDLSTLADNVAEMYRFVAEERDVEVATAIPRGLSARLDPERISQVLANLMDNAVKYTPAGGRVELQLGTSPGEIHIRVIDNGSGIAAEDFERIWERLYRGRNDRTKGLGIGLSLVRAVVRAHGGEVSARNNPAGGATFEVVLPSGQSAVQANLSGM